MLARDRDAVSCDLAQYYQIYRLDALPAEDVARLAVGLPPDSRIMRILSGRQVPLNTMLLASIADSLRWLQWTKTKDGQRGRNQPVRILNALLNTPEDTESNTKVFDSIEAFEAAREMAIQRK